MIITRTEFFLLPTTNKKKNHAVCSGIIELQKKKLVIRAACLSCGRPHDNRIHLFFAKQLSKAWNVFSPSRKQKFKRSVPIKYRPYHLARNE
jgi:hypothetical protein